MDKDTIKKIIYLNLGYILEAPAIVLMVNSNMGLSPWDVLNQGLSQTTGMTLGQATMIIGILVIIASVSLGENLGWGTIGNIFIPSILIDVVNYMEIIPVVHDLFWGSIMLIAGLVIMAISTVLYLMPALGCGPRDGLMIAIHKKTGKSIGFLRAIIEVGAVVAGYLLGGTVGIGTIISAFGLGYMLEVAFKIFGYDPKTEHKMIFAH